MSSTPSGVRGTLRGYTAITGALAVVAGLGAAAVAVFLPAMAEAPRLLLGLALLFLVVFVVGSFDDVRAAIASRQTKYGTNALVMVLAFAAIMGVVNYLAAQFPQRVDMTAGGQFTLSQHTQSVLRSLAQPVQVTAFFVASDPEQAAVRDQVESLLREYEHVTPMLTHTVVDPNTNPSVARQYQVQTGGLIVFEQSGRRQVVNGIAEQDFTGGILKVVGQERLRVYVLTGHGERDLTGSDANGYNLVSQALDAENYEVAPLDLTTTPSVPANASLVIVASPQKPMLDPEVKALDDYLVNGGKAFFLLDPNPRAELQPLLAKWGVKLQPGQVVDPSAAVQNQPTVVVARQNQYVQSQITQFLGATVFPGALGLTFDVPQGDQDHVAVSPLVGTTPDAFASSDPSRTSFNQGSDQRGPFALALTVQADRPIGQRPANPLPAPNSGQQPTRPTRIAVFGDSDFATNNFFYSLSNSDFMINTVNWLTAQEELISIRPKPPEFRRLVITQAQWNFIMASSVVIWPALLLLGGGFVWWRRR